MSRWRELKANKTEDNVLRSFFKAFFDYMEKEKKQQEWILTREKFKRGLKDFQRLSGVHGCETFSKIQKSFISNLFD